MSYFRSLLEQFLESLGESKQIEQLTPDASTREYFRIGWRGGSAIACIYPEPFSAAERQASAGAHDGVKSERRGRAVRAPLHALVGRR